MKYLHKGSSAVDNAPPKKKTLKRCFKVFFFVFDPTCNRTFP